MPWENAARQATRIRPRDCMPGDTLLRVPVPANPHASKRSVWTEPCMPVHCGAPVAQEVTPRQQPLSAILETPLTARREHDIKTAQRWPGLLLAARAAPWPQPMRWARERARSRLASPASRCRMADGRRQGTGEALWCVSASPWVVLMAMIVRKESKSMSKKSNVNADHYKLAGRDRRWCPSIAWMNMNKR
jgi:hypothetical protein